MHANVPIDNNYYELQTTFSSCQ